MNYKYLLTEVKDGVGIITINNPEKRNALNLSALSEIESVLGAWRKDDRIKVLIFTGAGNKSFVAGADINQLKERTAVSALEPNMTATYRKIEEYEKPIIAAINGTAVGGGLELALACDIRVATSNIKLGLPEVHLGIIPGAGGSQRLARIIGKGRAMRMILTGEIITSEQAIDYGLITDLVEQDQLMNKTLEIAEKIAVKGPLSLRVAKTLLNKGADIDMDTALMFEKYAQAMLMATDDKTEGISAFLEKRTPEFQGK
ncbi:enoyl-CoA hydratase/isomerase family protein [Halobacillus mangrovi]|uniref:Enoyl-CoA hydratase n=1 Tax=Halobacillus mangrovi TaxID=402384 RepID=A0A1W5ZUC3_9BACI|nr:enoyl-CoA hydratase-related protein [Halobacillus mangrovi]ARI76888.1 enoyl-CoA hydratase [Halobacillus mangrovi]